MKNKVVYAVVTAPSRRMRCRVARVVVDEVFEMGCAMVTERTLRGAVTHFLPFSRLASKRADIAKKLRAYLSTETVTELRSLSPGTSQTDSAVSDPAETGSAYWYQRDAEPLESFPTETDSQTPSGAGVTAAA